MSDSMWIQGKEYISSKRASEISGYAQDYIGQLARKGIIDAQRVGGLWFISMASLTEYKSHAESYVPRLPERKETPEVDSLVSFDGKDHISASRAAKITGYHQDYVGQLARSGAIISRQVGNRWYVDREAILAHKQEKDSLLGAVQAESVGISRNADAAATPADAYGSHYNGPGPLLTYTRDEGDLLPVMAKSEPVLTPAESVRERIEENEPDQGYAVPIRKIRPPILNSRGTFGKAGAHAHGIVRVPAKTISYGTFRTLGTAALTIVIVLSFGFVSLKNSSVYGTRTTPAGQVVQGNMFAASAAGTLEWIGRFLQNLFVRDIIYRRVE